MAVPKKKKSKAKGRSHQSRGLGPAPTACCSSRYHARLPRPSRGLPPVAGGWYKRLVRPSRVVTDLSRQGRASVATSRGAEAMHFSVAVDAGMVRRQSTGRDRRRGAAGLLQRRGRHPGVVLVGPPDQVGDTRRPPTGRPHRRSSLAWTSDPAGVGSVVARARRTPRSLVQGRCELARGRQGPPATWSRLAQHNGATGMASGLLRMGRLPGVQAALHRHPVARGSPAGTPAVLVDAGANAWRKCTPASMLVQFAADGHGLRGRPFRYGGADGRVAVHRRGADQGHPAWSRRLHALLVGVSRSGFEFPGQSRRT